MPNYATKNKLEDSTGVDTSSLAAKSDFIALKAEVDKLDINYLANVPISLNNLQRKVHDLDADKLKTIFVYLNKLSDVTSKEVVKNAKFNKLNTKINDLENALPHAFTLIQANQYKTNKQIWRKKLEMLIKNT